MPSFTLLPHVALHVFTESVICFYPKLLDTLIGPLKLDKRKLSSYNYIR